MCSQYWNIEVTLTCPSCNKEITDNAQTHFMGEIGSCVNYYKVGENIPELHGCTILLGDYERGFADDLTAICPECDAFISCGARIESGVVLGVWPYAWHDYRKDIHWKIAESGEWTQYER